jgi:hypothetical protein
MTIRYYPAEAEAVHCNLRVPDCVYAIRSPLVSVAVLVAALEDHPVAVGAAGCRFDRICLVHNLDENKHPDIPEMRRQRTLRLVAVSVLREGRRVQGIATCVSGHILSDQTIWLQRYELL